MLLFDFLISCTTPLSLDPLLTPDPFPNSRLRFRLFIDHTPDLHFRFRIFTESTLPKDPDIPVSCNMLSAFHIENFRPWAFPPPTQIPSPTQSAPPTRFPLPKQHPPSQFPRSHSPCNKSSALKLCDEPRPRTLPLPKHPLSRV